MCGAMADLVPPHAIAEVTELLQAPYLNSFGVDRNRPASATRALIADRRRARAAVEAAKRLLRGQARRSRPTTKCATGHARGTRHRRRATLFSGYWQAQETNARDFRGGWFHMGDVFRRNDDGSLDFVDRAKYMIKSGGENVYPAEIERVLLSDSRITEAAVVQRYRTRNGAKFRSPSFLPRRQRDRSRSARSMPARSRGLQTSPAIPVYRFLRVSALDQRQGAAPRA